MTIPVKRLLCRHQAYASGAWNGINDCVDAACAAGPSTAARPAKGNTGSRRTELNVLWKGIAMLCGLCRSYRAASSCSSPATSSRAAIAAGEACDLDPLSLPSSFSLPCGFWSLLRAEGFLALSPLCVLFPSSLFLSPAPLSCTWVSEERIASHALPFY